MKLEGGGLVHVKNRNGVGTVAELAQQLLNGLIAGSSYALIALGLTLIYGIMAVPNFALGGIYALGAFIAFYWVGLFGSQFFLAALIPIIIIGAVIGFISERFIFRPLQKGPHAAGFVVALGLYSVMEGGWNVLFGTDWRSIHSSYNDMIIKWGPLSLTFQRLLVLVVSIIVATGVYLLIMRTMTGKKIRAASENADAAALLGINLNKMSLVTFGLGSSLSGIAGGMIAPTFMVGASMGLTPITKAFIVVVLGGMGSIRGAVVGGLILGIAETLGAGYVSSMYKDVFSFGLFLLVLILMPGGLFKR